MCALASYPLPPALSLSDPGQIRCATWSVLSTPVSLRWEVAHAATAGVKRRRLTAERTRQLVTDFKRVTIRELAVDLRRAVDLSLQFSIHAYDAYIMEGARSSGFPLLALDGPAGREEASGQVAREALGHGPACASTSKSVGCRRFRRMNPNGRGFHFFAHCGCGTGRQPVARSAVHRPLYRASPARTARAGPPRRASEPRRHDTPA
jgi:predicted nucleic acid-binding protein